MISSHQMVLNITIFIVACFLILGLSKDMSDKNSRSCILKLALPLSVMLLACLVAAMLNPFRATGILSVLFLADAESKVSIPQAITWAQCGLAICSVAAQLDAFGRVSKTHRARALLAVVSVTIMCSLTVLGAYIASLAAYGLAVPAMLIALSNGLTITRQLVLVTINVLTIIVLSMSPVSKRVKTLISAALVANIAFLLAGAYTQAVLGIGIVQYTSELTTFLIQNMFWVTGRVSSPLSAEILMRGLPAMDDAAFAAASTRSFSALKALGVDKLVHDAKPVRFSRDFIISVKRIHWRIFTLTTWESFVDYLDRLFTMEVAATVLTFLSLYVVCKAVLSFADAHKSSSRGGNNGRNGGDSGSGGDGAIGVVFERGRSDSVSSVRSCGGRINGTSLHGNSHVAEHAHAAAELAANALNAAAAPANNHAVVALPAHLLGPEAAQRRASEIARLGAKPALDKYWVDYSSSADAASSFNKPHSRRHSWDYLNTARDRRDCGYLDYPQFKGFRTAMLPGFGYRIDDQVRSRTLGLAMRYTVGKTRTKCNNLLDHYFMVDMHIVKQCNRIVDDHSVGSFFRGQVLSFYRRLSGPFATASLADIRRIQRTGHYAHPNLDRVLKVLHLDIWLKY